MARPQCPLPLCQDPRAKSPRIISSAFARGRISAQPAVAMVAGLVPGDPAKPELEALWQDVQGRLRASVPASTFQLWLAPLKAVGARAGVLYLSAPDNVRAWTERRYTGLIREALAAGGSELTDVSFATGADDSAGDPSSERDLGLNVNYTFDRFVIGEGNRARPRCRAGRRRGALGGLQPALPARPSRARQDAPAGRDRQLPRRLGSRAGASATRPPSRFTNEFVAALRTKGASEFKRRYRDLDVLLVDDVQFLEGKRNTEDEFFHTFNALYEGGSQLVLSADRIPSELSTLETRLRDRFEWGLTVAVEPPNLATRLTVLRRLVREAGARRRGRGADRARAAHRRQRAPAPRRPHPRHRPRLAHRQAAQRRAGRRGDPGGLPLPETDPGRGDPAARLRRLRHLARRAGRLRREPRPRSEPGRSRSTSPAS